MTDTSYEQEMPLVSVMLIAYNEEKYISEALDSILAQKTTFPFEILCHDDASTDHTQAIILEYQKKYPNIIVPILQKENQMQFGENIIINHVYPRARGKYIAYCDGDDYWTCENKLQIQVGFLESHDDYAMCFHDFEFLYEATDQRKRSSCGNWDCDMETEHFIKWNAKKVPQIGTGVFRKDLAYNRPALYHKVGGGADSLRPTSDSLLYIYMSMHGKIKYFAKPMSVWRRRVTGTWAADSHDNNKKIVYNKQYIDFFYEFDKETDYKYHKAVKRHIDALIVDIAYMERNFDDMKGHILNADLSGKMKLFMIISVISPRLGQRIMEWKFDRQGKKG